MRKLLYLLMLLVSSLSFYGCGRSDNNSQEEPKNPDEPRYDTIPSSNEATVPRVKDYQDADGTWHIFLKLGKMVTANVGFSKALLDSALANTSWKLDYCFVYDNNLISDSLTHYYGYLPLKIISNGTIKVWRYNDPIKYSRNGKKFKLIQPAWESRSMTTSEYYFYAVDYTDTLKRLVTEGDPWEAMFPGKFEIFETRLRMVWSPIKEK